MITPQGKRGLRNVKVELRRLLAEVIIKRIPSIARSMSLDSEQQPSPDEVDALKLELARELAATGFDEDDEPNPRGLQIEELINALNRYFPDLPHAE